MNKLLFGILLTAIVISCKDNKKERKYGNTPDKISKIVEENAISLLKDGRFHSVSIAVVKDGIELSKHYGELEIGKKNQPNDSTIYEIASVTKTFLGTVAAKAVL
ncbi:serine hydrolase, partial [Flagellimonas sp. S3867]|uniref:serine hydrolase n=1 Tax=Flagellimonas sp. S3867 TaxID=2768063 RepID=UPI00168829C3